MEPAKPIRLIIADDHRLFIEGLKAVLKKCADIKIVSEAFNGKELITQVEAYKPDVVITDITMPEMNGIEATKMIKKICPATQVIGLSFYNNPMIIKNVIEAGANSFLSKGCSTSEIIETIKAVREGDSFCNDYLSPYVISLIENAQKKKKEPKNLSMRETEITQLICLQLSNKEIANRLGLSERTVEDHRSRIQKKTGARNMIGVAVYAIKYGLITLSEL